MECFSSHRLMTVCLLAIPIYMLLKDIRLSPVICKHIQHRRQDSCLKGHFKDILLIVVFNSPFYENINLLNELYKGAFPSLLACGQEFDSKYNVLRADISNGIFAYECLTKAMELQTNFAGYLLINDDLVLNFWNLVRLDRSKIWEGPKIPITVRNFSAPKKWYWWDSRWGIKNCQRAFDEIYALENTSAEAKETVQEFIRTLEKNGGGIRSCTRGRSDIYYIPSHLTIQFQILANIFRKHKVFLEIAIPTITRFLTEEKDIQQLAGIYLPGKKGRGPTGDSSFFWTFYNENLDFIHPIKLHLSNNKHMNHALLENWITKTAKTWTKC